MKTTLVLPDPVAARLRDEAHRRGVTMSALVEQGLRLLLDTATSQPSALPPLPRWNSGGALIDVADREALYDSIGKG